MTWIAVLLAGCVVLGLRPRTAGGSTHLTMLVVICACLTLAYTDVLH